jgi:mannose-6-phosphate isomerase-like protein (cupin superfamily)
MSAPHTYGITLPNGSNIVHGRGANIKTPFTDIPVIMHELLPGQPKAQNLDHIHSASRSYAGQLGFIEFTTEYRLPRHVHISPPDSTNPTKQVFTAERILVLSGVALVELNGEIYVIPPKTLVTIAPGVPHTWTACAPGVRVPAPPERLDRLPPHRSEGGKTDDSHKPEPEAVVSTGQFLMVYEYEDPTGFFPTRQTETLNTVEDYERCDDLESIRIPALSATEVEGSCTFVWERETWKKNV